jgi:hypothetical protein
MNPRIHAGSLSYIYCRFGKRDTALLLFPAERTIKIGDDYCKRFLELLRRGGLMEIDNVFPGGNIANSKISDRSANAIGPSTKKCEWTTVSI